MKRKPAFAHLRGKRAELAMDVVTKGGDRFPAGTVVRLRSYFRGWTIDSEDGQRLLARRVDKTKVKVLP